MQKNGLKIIVSCSTKFWAFNLAEQLQKKGVLAKFYTSYSSVNNPRFVKFAKRIDREIIPKEKIKTNLLLAIGLKLIKNPYLWNNLFDRWVAWNISKSEADVFIGWSGMALHSIKAAKKKGMITIVERGSAHILLQNELLKEEYQRFKLDFEIPSNKIKKELVEYSVADYIAIPSSFVKKSFINEGVDRTKLLVNNYGSSTEFYKVKDDKESNKFIIIFFGALMIRKGLLSLFKALKQLSLPLDKYEVWFIGSIRSEVEKLIREYQEKNWIFKGHISHKKLAGILSQGSVGVVPSIEDGFGMVVPQLLACNVPVIVSENTGASDLIIEGKNGFVISVRNAKLISKHIEDLFHEKGKLQEMKSFISKNPINLSWEAYGDRYIENLKRIIEN